MNENLKSDINTIQKQNKELNDIVFYVNKIFSGDSNLMNSQFDKNKLSLFNDVFLFKDSMINQNYFLENDKNLIYEKLKHIDLQNKILKQSEINQEVKVALLNKINNDKLDSLFFKIQELNKENTSLKESFGHISLSTVSGIKIDYFGKLKNGMPSGLGIGFYQNGGYYFGNWKGNLREGFGKHQYKNGDVYEGEFLNDKRNGKGYYYYSTGDVFEGNWKDDLKNGNGKIVFNDGKVKTGVWEMNKLIE